MASSMGFEYLAEEKIREAIDQGMFDNLPGHGKPLKDLEDNLAGDAWMGLHVLRQNGFLPEWLELRKQISQDRDLVLAAETEWRLDVSQWGTPEHPICRHSRENYRRHITAINAKIDLHNLRCPSIHLEVARFRDLD